jgi:hypothetical protein
MLVLAILLCGHFHLICLSMISQVLGHCVPDEVTLLLHAAQLPKSSDRRLDFRSPAHSSIRLGQSRSLPTGSISLYLCIDTSRSCFLDSNAQSCLVMFIIPYLMIGHYTGQRDVHLLQQQDFGCRPL